MSNNESRIWIGSFSTLSKHYVPKHSELNPEADGSFSIQGFKREDWLETPTNLLELFSLDSNMYQNVQVQDRKSEGNIVDQKNNIFGHFVARKHADIIAIKKFKETFPSHLMEDAMVLYCFGRLLTRLRRPKDSKQHLTFPKIILDGHIGPI